jgi:hypothetical protein
MTVSELLRRTLKQARARPWLRLAPLLLLLLTATNAVLALRAPAPGSEPDLAFVAAGLVRGVGLVSFSVALLRIAAGSGRPRWLPDAGYFLYFAISGIGLLFSIAAGRIGADWPPLARILLVEAAAMLLFAPFLRWLVAAAVAQPLALDPRPWFHRPKSWLPAVLVLLLPLVALATLHALATLELLASADSPAFWTIIVADGLLSTLLVLLTLALRFTAYEALPPAEPVGYPAPTSPGREA